MARSIMYEMGVDAYTTAKVLGTDQVGCFMDSQSFNSYKQQAEVFFGLDVIAGGFILGPAIKFIKSTMMVSWQSQREGVKREKTNIDQLNTKVQEGWKELVQKAEQNILNSVEEVRPWLQLVQDLSRRLKKVGDQNSIKTLKELQGKLMEMLASLGVSTSKKRTTNSFPKALREALKLLANEHTISALTYQLQDQLEESDPDQEEDVPEFVLSDPSQDHNLAKEIQEGWIEGVEEYQDWSRERLWVALGLVGGSGTDGVGVGVGVEPTLPFFMTVQDPDGLHDPWKEPEWFKIPNNVVPFQPHWHQVVGILKALKNAMLGIPLLQGDDIGLGKTLQIASLISTLAFYHKYHQHKKAFPGIFGEARADMI
ncbi:hypothetical protein BYT27DRAFT_7254104 [Phlegmacium glaucopus]|nr:hypothetical protein BYT27DRAFT_7254104 [Phlegmacium glaucopus]